MKKIWLISLCGMGVLLSACSERDEAYYLKNADAAFEKETECEKAAKAAFLASDKQKLQELKQNSECKAAHNAAVQHRKAKEEQERLAKEAEQKAKIDSAKQQLSQKYVNLDWQKLATEYTNSECSKKWRFADDDVECHALKNLYDEKTAQAQAEMLKNNTLEALLSLEKTYCSADKRKYSACDVWGKAVNQKATEHFSQQSLADLSKEAETYSGCNWGGAKVNSNVCRAWSDVVKEKHKAAVEQYVKDPESLKRDFNQCVETLQPLEKAHKWQQISAVKDGYPCNQVKDARLQLGLEYGFDKKME